MPGLNTLRSVLSRLTLIPHWDPDQEQWDVCAIQVIESTPRSSRSRPPLPQRQVRPVTDADLKGKWSVVFFYPADFTFVCPTELGDLADTTPSSRSWASRSTAVSTDTHFTHKAWHDTSDTIGKIQYPMIGDPTGAITRNFGVMIEEGPGAARHLRHRPRRADPGVRGHLRAASAATPSRTAAQGQGRPVRRQPPGRGLPGQVGGGCRDPGSVARPGRQDLSPPPGSGSGPVRSDAHARPCHGRQRQSLDPPPPLNFYFKENNHARRHHQDPAQGLPEKLSNPIELVASLDDSAKSRSCALLDEIAALSTRSACAERRRCAQALVRRSRRRAERRACALPASRWATNSPRWCWRCCRTGRPPAQGRERSDRADPALDGDFNFETYISLSCHNCPDVVQALNLMAVLNPRIRPHVIDGGAVPGRGRTPRQIMAVPMVFLNGEPCSARAA
jgi:peroxiredoxin